MSQPFESPAAGPKTTTTLTTPDIRWAASATFAQNVETSVYSIEHDYSLSLNTSGGDSTKNCSVNGDSGQEERTSSATIRETQETLNAGRKSKDEQDKDQKKADMATKVRNFAGFWLLGLCNNYAYVIMLSAAFDILSEDFHAEGSNDIDGKGNSTGICNPTSTGAVLLADVMPALLVKLFAPFFFTNTQLRVVVVVGLSAASFLVTSLAGSVLLSFMGIVCASISSGLGEVTFLSYSAKFDRSTVSGWSSGTGAAGLVGAGAYAVCTLFMSPQTTLMVMLVIPVILACTFWLLIVHPKKNYLDAVATRPLIVNRDDSTPYGFDSQNSMASGSTSLIGQEPTTRDKIRLVHLLLFRFMLPLGLVYFFEYFINQGLFELLYFPAAPFAHKPQYRIYQVLYQLGVFVSRSSVSVVEIQKLWLLPFLQGLNFFFFLAHVLVPFIPNIWIVFGVILFEGLLGGGAYVNTFNTISKESLPQNKEFNMGITSLADSFGILLAALASMPTHKALCAVIDERI